MERVISTVIGSIYESASSSDRWETLFNEISLHLPIDYCDIVVGHHVMERPPVAKDNSIIRLALGSFEVESRAAFLDRPGMLDNYIDNYALLDPLVFDMDQQISSYSELHEVMSDDERRTSVYYNEFLCAHEIFNPARFVGRISPTMYLSLNVNWSCPADRVTSDDRRLLNLAASHAARSVDLEQNQFSVLGGVETLLKTLDMVDEAAFLLSDTGEVREMNRAARELLEYDTAIGVKMGRVTIFEGEASEQMQARLAAVNGDGAQSFASQQEFTISSSTSPKPLRARFIKLSSAKGLSAQGQTGGSAILVVDARHVAGASRLLTRAVLTNKERTAMLCLAMQGSEANAADALGITVNTFRSHRRSSYSKLGISKRSELLAILRG